MKKYLVIALSVGGLGNKIYKSGASVTEKNFPNGNCPDLVKKGFLKEDGETESVPEIENNAAAGAAKLEELMIRGGTEMQTEDFLAAKATIKEVLKLNPKSEMAQKMLEQIENRIAADNAEGKGDSGEHTEENEGDEKIKEYNDISEEELKLALVKRGISFNENSKKKYLYTLYAPKKK